MRLPLPFARGFGRGRTCTGRANGRRQSSRPLRVEPLEARRLLSLSTAYDEGFAALEAASADAPGFELAGSASFTLEAGAYDPTRVLVRFESDADAEQLLAGLLPGAQLGRPMETVPGLREVHLSEGVGVADALALLTQSASVLYAEPNYRLRLAEVVPNDPQFSRLWGLNNTGQTGGTPDADIDATAAWSVTTGSPSTIVAVMDTGVDWDHPDLAANIWTNSGEIIDGVDNDENGFVDDVRGWDFVNNDNNPDDDHGHGTHVAGTIAAVGDNGIGVAGVAWNVQIMPLKILAADGEGTVADAIAALDYAVSMGATVSNHSYGDFGDAQDPELIAFRDAIAAAGDAGHVLVAAAGNSGADIDQQAFFPAGFDLDNLISVAATDDDDVRASFSNYGPEGVDLGAPGVSIYSTIRGGTYGYNSGTSMAAPHVTGAVALVQSQHPDWSYTQVIDALLYSVDANASLAGLTTTGGRLNVGNALLPPFVVDATPADQVFAAQDRFTLRFSKEIDESTFTIADVVNLSGPGGAISPTAVNRVDPRTFEVLFQPQDEPGTYSLTIGPNIADRAAQLLDQDGDGVAGETLDDRFTATFTLRLAGDFQAQFDFGTSTSPLASGYTRVSKSTGYSAALGYGWLSGTIGEVNRTSGSDLDRDFNYTQLGTFVVDLPDGSYDVTLRMGNLGPYSHDQMGVFLEGTQVDSVSTAAGQVVARSYSNVQVSDGQLTLLLDDLGGSDPNVVIEALQIAGSGPDVTPPAVTSRSPSPGATIAETSVDIDVTFSEAVVGVDATDMVLSGPASAGAVVGTPIYTGGNTWRFPLSGLGDGTLGVSLAPDADDIEDAAGNDLANLAWTYTVDTSVPAVEAQFDFGTSTSPLASGYTRVSKSTGYSAALGYGWLSGTIGEVNRTSGTDLDRDFNYTERGTFVVDVPDGSYDVTVRMGNLGPYSHDQMGVFLEGTQVDSVSTAAGQVVARSYSNVQVSDGQLTLLLDDLGGSDPNVVIEALQIAGSGPDVTPPTVTGRSPSPGATIAETSVDIDVTFSEAVVGVDATDMVLSGPASAGASVGTPIHTGGNTWRFPVSGLGDGTLGVSLAPDAGDIEDAAGNDLANLTWTYTVDTSVPAVEAKFDFGTATSPLASGYTRVSKSTAYSAALGYGWLSGTIGEVNRSSGTDLDRDFNYTQLGTFVVDLPDGSYDVTLRMGNLGPYSHDQMGVFLEGTQVDSVSTAAGQVVARSYSNVQVSDGQLTLLLDDLGGSDPNVVIEALQIAGSGPDVTPPAVTGRSPNPGATIAETSVDIDVTFSEQVVGVDATDMVLSGPASVGAAVGTPIHTAGNTWRFPVSGLAEGTLGVSLAPDAGDIEDTAGNDLANLTWTYTVDTSVPAVEAKFDFGTSTSPLASGYTRVSKSTAYSAALGYGWLSGTIGEVNRSSGTDLDRDFNYTQRGTFVVDLPDGSYDVTVRMGNFGPYSHDQMGVFLEGTQVDSVSTAAGQVVARSYSSVQVSDGQLTLLLDDLGGSDPNVVIEALEIVGSGPDVTPPAVTSRSPSPGATIAETSVDIDVTFSEQVVGVDATDMVLSGPASAGASVGPPIHTGGNTWQFPVSGLAEGTLGVSLAPDAGDIEDAAGNDLANLTWTYTVDTSVPAVEAKFDFGTSTSPLASGYTRVSKSTGYSAALGYGWLSGTIGEVNRSSGTDLDRDFNYTQQGTFVVDVPDGSYDVTVRMGNLGPYSHDQMGVFLEGTQVDSVNTAAGQVVTRSYLNVQISDGQLTLLLDDLGGSDPNVVIEALDVAATPSGGARVAAASPGGDVPGPVDRFTLTFDRPIDAATFTPEDVSELAGPGGPIAVAAIDRVDDLRYDVVFSPQFNPGQYRLTVGPEIYDESGTPMNQDQDGTSGETADDRYACAVTVVGHAPAVVDPLADLDIAGGTSTVSVSLAGAFDDEDIPTFGDALAFDVRVAIPVSDVVAQISEASYTRFHQDDLYTHLGDDRGGGPEHDLARQNIYDHFLDLGLATSLEPFWYDGQIYHNVVGVKLGSRYPEQVYILGAHYDSVSNPGADDNASGTAAVMEAARVLASHQFESTVVFIAFDREEQGLRGSRAYAEEHLSDDIVGMVNLDMIAYNPGGADTVRLYDTNGVGSIKADLIDAFNLYGGGVTAGDAGQASNSDHAPFDNVGFDAALIIESRFGSNPHYHRATDAVETPDYIDYAFATNVTAAAAGYLAGAAGLLDPSDLFSATIDGDQLILDFAPGLAGTASVVVTATDTVGLFVTDTFDVTVTSAAGATAVLASNPASAQASTLDAPGANRAGDLCRAYLADPGFFSGDHASAQPHAESANEKLRAVDLALQLQQAWLPA